MRLRKNRERMKNEGRRRRRVEDSISGSNSFKGLVYASWQQLCSLYLKLGFVGSILFACIVTMFAYHLLCTLFFQYTLRYILHAPMFLCISVMHANSMRKLNLILLKL